MNIYIKPIFIFIERLKRYFQAITQLFYLFTQSKHYSNPSPFLYCKVVIWLLQFSQHLVNFNPQNWWSQYMSTKEPIFGRYFLSGKIWKRFFLDTTTDDIHCLQAPKKDESKIVKCLQLFNDAIFHFQPSENETKCIVLKRRSKMSE